MQLAMVLGRALLLRLVHENDSEVNSLQIEKSHRIKPVTLLTGAGNSNAEGRQSSDLWLLQGRLTKGKK